MDAEAGLKLVKFFLYFQDHIGEVVHGAVAVAVNASYVYVSKVIVCT